MEIGNLLTKIEVGSSSMLATISNSALLSIVLGGEVSEDRRELSLSVEYKC